MVRSAVGSSNATRPRGSNMAMPIEITVSPPGRSGPRPDLICYAGRDRGFAPCKAVSAAVKTRTAID